jgi:hypothetical protein
VSGSRQHRVARQVERAVAFLDEHPTGVTRRAFAEAIGCPESSVSTIGARLRAKATEIGKTYTCLKIGGEYLNAWAENLRDHLQEHLKRRKNEKRSLRLSIETLEQSVSEHPESEELSNQLMTARHRLETVEHQIEVATGQLHLVRAELREDAA